MNFNVDFNVPQSKYIVHPLVNIKKKDFDNIKMHGTTTKILESLLSDIGGGRFDSTLTVLLTSVHVTKI